MDQTLLNQEEHSNISQKNTQDIDSTTDKQSTEVELSINQTQLPTQVQSTQSIAQDGLSSQQPLESTQETMNDLQPTQVQQVVEPSQQKSINTSTEHNVDEMNKETSIEQESVEQEQGDNLEEEKLEEKISLEGEEEEEEEEKPVKKKKDSDDEYDPSKGEEIDDEIKEEIFGASDDDDEYKEERKTRKKRKKTSKSKPLKKKRRLKKNKSTEEISGDPEYIDEEEEISTTRIKEPENDEFDRIMKEIKPKGRSYKSVELSKTDDDAAEIAEDLISRMNNAYEEDRKANQEKKPAIAKLMMLPEVLEKASKSFLWSPLVDGGLLDVLCKWIEPLEDGTLPNMNVRKTVLQVLSTIPVKGQKAVKRDFEGIDINHLKCGIGKVVKLLANHPKETPDNVRLANILIERWSRLIFGLSDDYRELARFEEELASSPQFKKYLRLKKLSREEEQETKQQKEIPRARVPMPTYHDYIKRPKMGLSLSELPSRPSPTNTQLRLQKRLIELTKKKNR